MVDLLVVGGGINGCGIARDAAGRGLRVVLCEKDDLAQGTSSRSSRLIHGGLRYLEHGELRLVREALHERAILLQAAPHLVRPMQFVLPHVPAMRPAWMLRLGLFFYDHLAARGRLPASRAVRLDAIAQGGAVRHRQGLGFLYADCRTDDARLVIHNAVDARERGARILPRTEVLGAAPCEGGWDVVLRAGGTQTRLRARALVNAAGPWVAALAQRLPPEARCRPVRLVKGSHIIVNKFWTGDHAFLLQNEDRRVTFVTPYEDRHALVGTTDIAYSGIPEDAAITPEEIDYLCAAANRQLRCALTPGDVQHAYAGVRCLVDDAHANPASVTRDYELDLAASSGMPPLLSVVGGKITTFRRLAEQALQMLRPHFPGMGPAWTATTPLPGGDFGGEDFAQLREAMVAAPDLPVQHRQGLLDRHGTRAYALIDQGLGRHFGAGFYEREALHFLAQEWAQCADDILWRRSKFGLRMAPAEQEQFRRWLAERPAAH